MTESTEMDWVERVRSRHFERSKHRIESIGLSLEACRELVACLEEASQVCVDQRMGIIEMGSGLSTTLIRTWLDGPAQGANRWGFSLVTTDGDPKWLGRTQFELMIEGLPLDGCILHDFWISYTYLEGKYRDADPGPYHFAFLDLGPAARRPEAFAALAPNMADRSIVLVDDWHKEHMREPMRRVLEHAGYEIDVTEEVEAAIAAGGRNVYGAHFGDAEKWVDQWGRYMAVARRL